MRQTRKQELLDRAESALRIARRVGSGEYNDALAKSGANKGNPFANTEDERETGTKSGDDQRSNSVHGSSDGQDSSGPDPDADFEDLIRLYGEALFATFITDPFSFFMDIDLMCQYVSSDMRYAPKVLALICIIMFSITAL